MKTNESGQSLVETILLTTLISLGVAGLWVICSKNIIQFVNLILRIIASPTP